MPIKMINVFLHAPVSWGMEMKVRKVVTPSGRGVRGYFPSRKIGRMVAWESLLERDAILLLEYSSAVIRYAEQPARVNFLHEGKIRLYIPDFSAEICNIGNIHVEVKPSAKLLVGSKTANLLDSIASHYRSTDTAFRILTEKELRRQPRLTNLRLLAYHSGRLHPSDRQSLVDRLLIQPANTIAAASRVLGDIRNVYRLLADGEYQCDLECALKPGTVIHKAIEGETHATFQF